MDTDRASIAIRDMKKKDLGRVAELERLCFSMPWSEKALASELKNKVALYQVLEHDGKIAAYAGMWLVLDEAHVTNVAVDPEFRRQGLGLMLMLDMMRRARSRGATRMTLEVREKNYGAQSFYAALGFIKAGIRRGYYSDTGEDAFILWNDSLDATLEKFTDYQV